jgi:MarR family transcriptional regulator for hemolysin
MQEPSESWQPGRMPAMLISRAAQMLARIADARLRDLGLATAQIPVFVALKDGSRLTQKELARLAGVEQPSMAQLLARMKRDGLIRREADPADKRSSLISLTDFAFGKLAPGRAVLAQGNRDALTGFEDQDVEKLVELLGRVLANLGGAGDCPGPKA